SRVTRGTVCPTSALVGCVSPDANTRAPSAATRRAPAGCGQSRPRGHRPRKRRSRRHRPQNPLAHEGAGQESTGPRGGTGSGAYRLTLPVALMICWKAVGGIFCEHLPAAFLAATARMFNLYVPVPLIFAYAPVPPESLKVPCPTTVSRQVLGLKCC